MTKPLILEVNDIADRLNLFLALNWINVWQWLIIGADLR